MSDNHALAPVGRPVQPNHLVIEGGVPLSGRLVPSANKNAVLPVLCASLLTREPVRLRGVPDITDVRKILAFFESIGSQVQADFTHGVVDLLHRDARFDASRHRLPVDMRSSIMLVPPLVVRFGEARIEDEVTGCTLGAREIDPHIELLRAVGARVERRAGYSLVTSDAPLKPADHWPDYASVTTTENFVLCAALASGWSTLTNAACEPHVQEFCAFMGQMGARIHGVGTSRLRVEGVDALGGVDFSFVEDFHEVTTLLALGAITGGEVMVRNSMPQHFPLIDRCFAKFGAQVTHRDGWSRVQTDGRLRVAQPHTDHLLQKVEAAPWPYLPVDLLPIFIALGACAEGSVMYWNKVYEGALGWTSELHRFGARVHVSDPHRVVTFGGAPLHAAQVESPYIIRVAIALLMVAASVRGRSVIRHAAPIRRAHPNFAENLRTLGARIEWTDQP